MGGLVASGYLALGSAQRNKVETVITLGSPLLGTSVVPYLWGSEDVNVTGLLNDLGLPDWAETLIDLVALYYNPLDWLMGNFGSMYEMFPSEKYFDSLYADKTYLVTSFVGIGDLVISTYADTRQRLNSYLPHYNAALADSAEDFHDSLYINGEHITSYVNTYYIAGYGKQTVDIIEFNMWDWYIYEYTYDGDQMVAEWSATLGDRYSNKTFFAEDVSHVGLVANSNVKLFIAQLIQGNTSTSAFANIYDNMPQSNS
jgi:hypothetical protein